MAAKRVPLRDPRSTEAKATLGDLLARQGLPVSRGDAVEAEPEPGEAASAAEGADTPLAGCGKIVLRREGKGHGGKTVTVIEGLGLPDRVLQDLARQLRKALGCGSSVDGRPAPVAGRSRRARRGRAAAARARAGSPRGNWRWPARKPAPRRLTTGRPSGADGTSPR